LPTGNGSAGITVAESASAAAMITADFIRRLSPYYLAPALGERRHRSLAHATHSITSLAMASSVGGTPGYPRS
jgi:hypothetical protein